MNIDPVEYIEKNQSRILVGFKAAHFKVADLRIVINVLKSSFFRVALAFSDLYYAQVFSPMNVYPGPVYGDFLISLAPHAEACCGQQICPSQSRTHAQRAR